MLPAPSALSVQVGVRPRADVMTASSARPTPPTGRMARIAGVLERAGVDALVVPATAGNSATVKYVGGAPVAPEHGVAVVRPHSVDADVVVLLVDDDQLVPADCGWMRVCVAPPGRWADHLPGGRIGTAGTWPRPAPTVALVDVTHGIDELRVLKDGAELAGVEESAYLLDRVVTTLLAVADPGRTRRQVAADLQQRAVELGASRLVVRTHSVVADARGRRLTADMPGEAALRASEVIAVGLDLAGPSGYWASTTRPLVLAAMSEPDEVAGRASGAALATIIHRLRPGVAVADVIALGGRAAVEADGVMSAASVAGIGLDPIEGPSGGGLVAEAGMVLRVEVTARSGDGAAMSRQGDTIVVEREAARTLGRYPIGPLLPDHRAEYFA